MADPAERPAVDAPPTGIDEAAGKAATVPLPADIEQDTDDEPCGERHVCGCYCPPSTAEPDDG